MRPASPALRAKLTSSQFVIPMEFAMMKEISIKFSMAYDNIDFKAVVDDFIAGEI